MGVEALDAKGPRHPLERNSHHRRIAHKDGQVYEVAHGKAQSLPAGGELIELNISLIWNTVPRVTLFSDARRMSVS